MFETGQLRATDPQVRPGEHLQLETEPGCFFNGDACGVVGARVVDEQDVELDPGATHHRCGLLDLCQHRADRRTGVVGGEHHRAAQFWHLGKVPPRENRSPAAVLLRSGVP